MFEACTPHASPREALQHAFELWAVTTAGYIPPCFVLWLAIFSKLRGRHNLFQLLAFATMAVFALHYHYFQPKCSVVRCMVLWCDLIGGMKALDLWRRRGRFPQWRFDRKPHDGLVALACLFELRYESFNPNFVHTASSLRPKGFSDSSKAAVHREEKEKTLERIKHPENVPFASRFNFSEVTDYFIHIGIFLVLQNLFPQTNPKVLALEVLLSIYLVGESIQLMLRYRTSPRLFGALYKINSLGNFWSRIWHTAFMSPSRSLAYEPARWGLPEIGIPVAIARIGGVITTFAFMGLFHIIGLAPLFPLHVLVKVGLFFLLNGIATVFEAAIWGHKEHWLKTLLAWVFEVNVAGWAVEAMQLPQGLHAIEWKNICCVNKQW